MKNNTRKTLLSVALSLAAATLLVGLGSYAISGRLLPLTPDTKPVSAWRIVAPFGHPETRTFNAVAGREMSIEQLDNGDTRTRWYHLHSNGMLAEEKIVTAAAVERRHVKYAADGQQIVSGFELRADGSVKWSAGNKGGIVIANIFWANGAVFASQERAIGAKEATTKFFRPDGSRQAIYFGLGHGPDTALVGLSSYPDKFRLFRYFDRSGKLRYELNQDIEKSERTFVYYRTDGTVSHSQHHSLYDFCSDGGCGMGIALKLVREYDATGQVVLREFEMNPDSGSYEPRIATIIAADGSRVSYSIIDIVHRDAAGNVTHKEEKLNAVRAISFNQDKARHHLTANIWNKWQTEEKSLLSSMN